MPKNKVFGQAVGGDLDYGSHVWSDIRAAAQYFN